MATFRATASHMVMVKKPGENRFHPRLAHEIGGNDFVNVQGCSRLVERIDHDVDTLAVVELKLTDTKGSFFAASQDMESHGFVEVCGALTPLHGSTVELLRFQRFDRFRDIINTNPELASCRKELVHAGYDIDLGVCNLGAGKLLVRAGLAQRSISALHHLCVTRGHMTKASEVAVSSELKQVLLEQVERSAPRMNKFTSETLKLGPLIIEARSFAATAEASSSSVTGTNSSTDAHLGPGCNPRKKAQVASCP
jgi:hypothetical protein